MRWTVCFALTPALTFAASIVPIGDLPGGPIASDIAALSMDGSVAVGNSNSANGFEAFRWSAISGLNGLGDLAGGGFSSFAYDANLDGTVIVGRGTPSTSRGFKWTPSGGMVQLPDFVGTSTSSSEARGVSANGSVIVGQSNSLANGIRATVWQNNQPPFVLPDIPGGNTFNTALGVSADGTNVVGWGTSAAGFEAVVWRNGVLTIIGDFAGSNVDSRANEVSDDGVWVVGAGWDANSRTAFLWSDATGLQLLGSSAIGGPAFNSEAFDCSANGAVVVGNGNVSGSGAFIYTKATGMLSLISVLSGQGVDMTGWNLTTAKSISADGTVIAGQGIVNGAITGYVATINLQNLTGRIRGQVVLENVSVSVAGEPVTLQLVNSGGQVEESATVWLDSSGMFNHITNLRGTYDIRIKGSHWLSKVNSSQVISGANLNLPPLSLKNGDVNGDNEVGPSDFALLAQAFGAELGDAGYLRTADLDRNDEVGPSDFSILSSNFGEEGE